MDEKKKRSPLSPLLPNAPKASGAPPADVPFHPAGSSLVPAPPISVPPQADSLRVRVDSAAPFPSISIPPTDLRLAAPQIRLQGLAESVAPPSLPPPQVSLRPPPASPRKLRGLLLVLLVAIAALAIARPSIRDLGIGGARARAAPIGTFAYTLDVSRFQRGNMHTHTTLSDGKDTPRAVATWYREHGYQFLAITDHDRLDDLTDLADIEGGGFVLLPAEEITSSAGSDRAPVHINGICISKEMRSNNFGSAGEALADAVGAIRAQHGFAIVNHPNFRWAMGTSDVASLSGPYALEIWSGHPDVHNLGNALHPSHEQIWDELLARGRDVTAVGIDDMHVLAPDRDPPHEPLPGRGWVYTFGAETSRAAICDALIGGRMYASSGVELRRIAVTPNAMTVWVDDLRASVDFVGNGGQILATREVVRGADPSEGASASYTLRGGEVYVRARVVVEGVGAAWTQAVRVGL